MSNSGFTCPKCDYSFPTIERAAEHLRNEHVDGKQIDFKAHDLICNLF